MSDLDRIRQELKNEEASLAEVATGGEDSEFDAQLAEAFATMEPSDAFIDAFFALPANVPAPLPAPSVVPVLEAARAETPAISLAALREQHGLSKQAAARMLDINVPALDRLETRSCLGWLNLAATRVHSYLDRLEISPAVLVRSIANQIPQGPSHVYGYRPRVIAEEAVTVEGQEDDLARLIAWGHKLYGPDLG